ncbi:MAG: DUF4446 family protein [Patescibacteria group bacterium]|nr:DUF4446 family protein [Patescibacteria group bacterium]
MTYSQLILPALIIGLLALLASLYASWQIMSFNRLRRDLFTGSNGLDLEKTLRILAQELNGLREEQVFLEQSLEQLKSDSRFTLQKIGLVRFNPFADGGGNFSFSLALLDGNNSGVVLTSMHGRQQNRIYTKKIQAGKSEMALTEEEQQAISLANAKQKPVS